MARGGDAGLIELMEPVIEHMGYELIGIEHVSAGRSQTLRVYIDSLAGITIDDCERVSRQLGALFDVEDPLRGQYTLEISSPGVDRLLTKPEHFTRFVGEKAKLRLHVPFEGQRNVSGYICGVEDGELSMELIDGTSVKIPLDGIEKARLVPQYD